MTMTLIYDDNNLAMHSSSGYAEPGRTPTGRPYDVKSQDQQLHLKSLRGMGYGREQVYASSKGDGKA
jgi:hypothetical protein